MIRNIKAIIVISLLLLLFKSANAFWSSGFVKYSNTQFIDGDNILTPFVAQKRKIINRKRIISRKGAINHIVYFPVYIPIFIPTNF